MEDKNQYLYMLNLNRVRIVIVGLIFLGLFSGFFFIGLAVGIKSTKLISAQESYQEEIPDDSTVYIGKHYDHLEDESPVHIKRESSLENTYDVPSAKLLESETPLAVKEKSQKITSPRIKNSIGKVPGPVQKYYIQLIVTGDKVKADKIVKTLLSKKYKGYQRTRNENGRKLYMVRVGLYTDQAKAENDLKVLKQKGGFKDAFIVKNNRPRKINPS